MSLNLLPQVVHFALTSNIENMTVIQSQHKGGAFKGPAKGQCLNCMDEQEYDLRVPVNGKETLKAVPPKAETLT